MINKVIVFFIVLLCVSNLYAASQVKFSPYADLTINAHWDPQYQDMEPMDLAQISQLSGVNAYHLAFITDIGNCNPAWGAQSSYSVASAWGSHLTDKLLKQNIPYVVSFGGASGLDMSMMCSSAQLQTVYEQVIKTYHPEGLDFDIENGNVNVDKMMLVLQNLQKNYPNLKISFTLPVLPEGLVTQGQDVVKKAQAAGLNFSVNVMAMDYGPSYSGDMGDYAVQAASNVFSFLKNLYPQKSDDLIWQMLQVTPMIGVNDQNTEHFTLANVDTLRQFAQLKNLGGLCMWSVARDNPCKDQWASPTCSGDDLQAEPYDFAKRFNQANLI